MLRNDVTIGFQIHGKMSIKIYPQRIIILQKIVTVYFFTYAVPSCHMRTVIFNTFYIGVGGNLIKYRRKHFKSILFYKKLTASSIKLFVSHNALVNTFVHLNTKLAKFFQRFAVVTIGHILKRLEKSQILVYQLRLE